MSAGLAKLALNLPASEAKEPTELEKLLRGHLNAVLTAEVELSSIDKLAAKLFEALAAEAKLLSASPLTSHMADNYVLQHETLPAAIGSVLAGKICRFGSSAEQSQAFRSTMVDVLSRPRIVSSVLADLAKAVITDPATQGVLQPIFFLKGFQALTTYRVAHALWAEGGACNASAALLLQSRGSELWDVDIHPGAVIGDGVMLDHACGIVIGSTAIVGNDVYMLHGTTLGATGKPMGSKRRHPKIGSSCIIGAGCTVLGDVTIGDRVTLGAAAVVTRDCPTGGTVIGVNNLLKRKARPTTEAAAAQSAAAQSGPPSVRQQFESRMAQQEELASAATEAASARAHQTTRTKPYQRRPSAPAATYLTLAPSSRALAPAASATAASHAAIEEHTTYSYFGDSDDYDWMYDRKAVEIVQPPATVTENEAYYDMFF